MEMKQLLESLRSDAASFVHEGSYPLERAHEALGSGNDGFAAAGNRRARRNTPEYFERLTEAVQIIKAAREHRYGAMIFEEAMQRADFPLYMGDVLDRQMLGAYREHTPTWREYCRVGSVPDFRSVKRNYIDGAEGKLPQVGEQGKYLPAVLTEGEYSYSVNKYGRIIKWSWESYINDNQDQLGDSSPVRLARAARRSEDRFATELHIDANGPHASLYTSGNKNIINTTNGASSSNPVLGIVGLQDAFTVMGLMLDGDGEPIGMDGGQLILEVGPALAVTAENLLGATQIIVGADSGAQRIMTGNWLRAKVRAVVNPYIPLVATSANTHTTWCLHADPNTTRPALEMGFLRGYEGPQLFQKLADQVRLGGGGSAMDGSFEDDSTAFKVRHVMGGGRQSGKATVSSNGSGS